MIRTFNLSPSGPTLAELSAEVALGQRGSHSFDVGGMPCMELELESVCDGSTHDRRKQADAVIAWLAAR
jgi:hypothetical protein